MKVKKSTKKVLQENGYPGRYTYQDIYFFLADHWGLFINLEYHQEYQAWTASAKYGSSENCVYPPMTLREVGSFRQMTDEIGYEYSQVEILKAAIDWLADNGYLKSYEPEKWKKAIIRPSRERDKTEEQKEFEARINFPEFHCEDWESAKLNC